MSLDIAVGIPTRNNADTIEETLKQLLEGTRAPDRIIIVDASEDETPEIIERVADSSAIPVDMYEQSGRGRGVGGARQDIYERFEGDLLACLDTDRRVSDDWLEKHVEFHESNPNVDILSAAPNSDVDERVENPKTPYFFQQANCTITGSALDAVDGWDPWLPRGEDWDMQIRLWSSDVTAHACGRLYGESMGDDSPLDRLHASLGRPSSVAFLRKYGAWYTKFHPIHPLGDMLSCIALFALVLTLPVWFVTPSAAVVTFGIVGVLSAAYLYVGHIRDREALVKETDLIYLARFFLLGITALRELVFGKDYPWNYGGFEENER